MAIRRIERDHTVIWCCDPMHGNTKRAKRAELWHHHPDSSSLPLPSVGSLEDIKYRNIEDIVNEIRASAAIHHGHGTWFGGIHLEYSHEWVTECLFDGPTTQAFDLSREREVECEHVVTNTNSAANGVSDVGDIKARISLTNLSKRYTTVCDPRLNPSQCMHIASVIGNILKETKISSKDFQ